MPARVRVQSCSVFVLLTGLLQHGQSLDLSPERIREDDLYQQTEADPETVSIATISSIEEEGDGAIDSAIIIPLTPGSEVDEMFLPVPTSSTSQTPRQTVENLAPVGEVRGGGAGSAEKLIPPADCPTGESEVSPSQQLLVSRAEINQRSAYSGAAASHMGEWEGEEFFECGQDEDSQLPSGDRGSGPVVSSAEDSEASLTSSHENPPPPTPARTPGSESEVIPPLIERLSALGVSPASFDEDGGHDASSVRSLISEASRLKIASVKER